MKLTRTNRGDKNFSKLLCPRFCVLVSLSAGLLLAFQGQAAVKTWDGSSNGNWGTAANWTGGVAPVDGDDLVFPSGAANLINTNNLSGLDLRTITFTGNGYTINGNAITITNGISGQQATGANTINPGITLGASQTFDCINAGASQQLNGAVALGPSFNLTISGNGDLGFAGVISGGGGYVSKNGTGTVTFSGASANTYTGITYVYAGVLQLSKAVPLTLPIVTRIAIPGDLVVGSGSIGPDIVRLFYNNQIANTSIVSVNGAGILDLNGNNDTIGTSLIMNGNAEIWSGVGLLTLGSNCTVTGNPSGGPCSIKGNLNVGASGTCTFDILANWFYLDAVVSGGANIVKTGAGRLFFNAANTFTGSLTADDGTVGVTDNLALGANGSPTSGTVISNTATLQIWTAVNVGTEYLTLNTTAPTVALFNSSDTNSWAGPIILIGTQVIDVWPGTLELSGAISGSGGITKIGAGTLRFSTAWDNSYSGNTVVNEGTLELSKPSYFWATGLGTLIIGDDIGGANADVVRYTSTGTDQVRNSTPVVINSSGLLDLNGHSDYVGNNLTLVGGHITTGAGSLGLSSNPSITISGSSSVSGNFNLGSGTCTIGGGGSLLLFANVSGSANIVKNESASLQLYGNNTFTGTMTANTSGYLLLGSDRALGDPGAGTTLNGNTHLYIYTDLNITNESLTLNSSYNPTIYVYGYTNYWNTTNFTLSADATIQVVSNGVLQIIAPITGSGGLAKDGPGRLVFSGSGDNTYTGNTVVEEGVLELNKSGGWAISHGALTIGDGWGGLKADIVRYTGGSSSEINTAVPITVRSTGWLDLNGHTDDVGPIELDNGQITTGAGSLLMYGDLAAYDTSGTNSNPSISGKITLGGTRTFSVSNSASLSISALVSGSAGLVKAGPSTLYLSGSNAYTGLTEVCQGYLWITDELALGTTASGTVVSNGASLVMSGGIGVTNESLTLNGPGVNSGWGAFDVESSGTNFWTGPIILNADSTIAPYSSGAHLRLSGAISGTGGLTVGPGSGTLYLDGSTANSYGGTTRVDSGKTLVLKKSSYNGTIPNDLMIYGTVRLNASEQISDSADVLVNAGALFDFGVYYESIDTLHGLGTVNFGTLGWISVGFNNGTSTFDGPFTGVGYAPGWTVGKHGTGTFTMNGNNTFSAGRITILDGKMLINGAQPQAPVRLEGGTLGGTGTVGQILAYGNLQPGVSPGCLTSSNLSFSSSGDFYVELNGTTPCTGYDQMVVRGTNNLANATLHVTTAFPPGDPVSLGDQFVILNNDGAEAVTGTFNGLTNGAEFAVGDYRFRINYGNDVILTAVGLPIEVASLAVSTGNGNHAVDPNECNFLDLILANPTAAPMNNVAAVLSTTHPRAMVTQPYSDYPNIPVGGQQTNATPFQLATLTNFVCGDTIPLHLAVTTPTHGSFVVPVTLHSGGAAATPSRYDNSVSVGIPDVGSIESTNTVAGFSGQLGKVVVSLWLTHTFDSDLNLSLIAPNGTTVDLSSGNGGGGDDYGNACSPDSSRTTFDDAAATPITAGSAPFVGTYIPEGSLANLIGGVANGNWRLQITDNFGGSLGTLRCWSLSLYGLTCTDGGGFCDVCLPSINGVIEASDPRQTNRWFREGVVASCGVPKAWYGDFGDTGTNFHHDVYTFTNLTGADACVTVSLQSANDVMAAMYLNSFNPADIAQNYHGDAGSSTAGGRTIFSATVPAGARFLVTVNEEAQNSGTQPYTLQLSGLPCPPPTLAIAPAGPPDQVRLHWPTSAGGYELEAKPALTSGGWNPVPNEPIVGGARYHVTNSNTSPPDQFYRLRKSQ